MTNCVVRTGWKVNDTECCEADSWEFSDRADAFLFYVNEINIKHDYKRERMCAGRKFDKRRVIFSEIVETYDDEIRVLVYDEYDGSEY